MKRPTKDTISVGDMYIIENSNNLPMLKVFKNQSYDINPTQYLSISSGLHRTRITRKPSKLKLEIGGRSSLMVCFTVVGDNTEYASLWCDYRNFLVL